MSEIPQNQHEGLKGLEAMAACEHESWSKWSRYMIDTMKAEQEGEQERLCDRGGVAVGDLTCVQRWERQIATPYSGLSEREKGSDREVAKEKAPVYLGAFVHMSKFQKQLDTSELRKQLEQ